MKVFQINSVCSFGSTGRIAENIHRALLAAGHDCITAYARQTPAGDIKTYKIGSSFGVALHGLLARLTDRQGAFSSFATRRLVRQIAQYDPDIIQLHNIHGYYLNHRILFDYLSRSRAKVVWTMHDEWAITGHCAYFSAVGCDQWRTGCQNCKHKDEYPRSLFFSRSAQNLLEKKRAFGTPENLHIIVPSRWLGGLLAESYLSKHHIHIINNGINTSVFHPVGGELKKKYSITAKHVVLGVANVWNDKKGLSDFVKLSALLPDGYKIVLVGLDENAMTLSKNIIAMPHTDRVDELAELYSMASVFVNSTYDDNFPTTNIEALSCGTPVVTYRTGGSPEALAEGCGAVVAQGDISGLAAAVTRLAGDPAAPLLCRRRGEEFDAAKKYAEYIALYTELLS